MCACVCDVYVLVCVSAWAGRLRSAVESALLSIYLGSGDHTHACVQFA